LKRVALLDGVEGEERVQALCQARHLDPQILKDLVAVVREQNRRARRRGLYEQFDMILSPIAADAVP